jgi:hypothetical protein
MCDVGRMPATMIVFSEESVCAISDSAERAGEGRTMEFYIPAETGEFLAFCAAVVTALIGVVFLFAPGLAYRVVGIDLREGRRGGYAEARSTMGGFHLGLGIAALLLAQPMVYLALGAAFALAAFGRILSMLSDGGNTVMNWLFLSVQIVLAALPLAYVFGLV